MLKIYKTQSSRKFRWDNEIVEHMTPVNRSLKWVMLKRDH